MSVELNEKCPFCNSLNIKKMKSFLMKCNDCLTDFHISGFFSYDEQDLLKDFANSMKAKMMKKSIKHLDSYLNTDEQVLFELLETHEEKLFDIFNSYYSNTNINNNPLQEKVLQNIIDVANYCYMLYTRIKYPYISGKIEKTELKQMLKEYLIQLNAIWITKPEIESITDFINYIESKEELNSRFYVILQELHNDLNNDYICQCEICKNRTAICYGHYDAVNDAIMDQYICLKCGKEFVIGDKYD